MSMLVDEDFDALKRAKNLLEKQTLAERVAAVLGVPVKLALGMVPAKLEASIKKISSIALRHAMEASFATLSNKGLRTSSDRTHKALTATSGALGGLFGFGALMIEIPVSTAIMARSIGDIARSYGEDLKLLETRFACLEVFALGESDIDQMLESPYYRTRLGLDVLIRQGARYALDKGMARFLSVVASRYSGALVEKAAAQAIPVLGTLGGASLNLIFMDHFQDKAHGHFTLRRLEREYGHSVIRKEYGYIKL